MMLKIMQSASAPQLQALYNAWYKQNQSLLQSTNVVIDVKGDTFYAYVTYKSDHNIPDYVQPQQAGGNPYLTDPNMAPR